MMPSASPDLTSGPRPSRRGSGIEPAVLRLLLAELDKLLDKSPDDGVLLSRKVALLRAVGDLAELGPAAERLLAIQPDHQTAQQLRMIVASERFNGVGRQGPVPFVRLTDVFTADERAGLWDGISRSNEDRRPAKVFAADGKQIVNPEERLATLYQLQAARRAWLIARLLVLIDRNDALRRIGMEPFKPGKVEMQVTYYSKAGRYYVHRDSGPAAPGRLVTFIYYLHRQPRRFKGGDLLLFDEPDPPQTMRPVDYTRIAPTDNSLVLFPSDRLHAVSEVWLETEGPLDGRWAINGWLHATALR
jgi:hypothetical protein